ncbi:hypothetical protein ACQJ8K_06915 [Helicobacter pylori]
MRKKLNALWTLKLCKIPMIETQSESQTLPQNISLKKPKCL